MNAKNSDRRMWSPRDGILILSLLVAALAVGLWQSWAPPEDGVCQVIYQGEVVLAVSLDEDRVFSIEQLPNVVFEVRDGRVAFIESDCPDKTCVHTGFIGGTRQFAACLPHQVALRIVAEPDEDALDAVL